MVYFFKICIQPCENGQILGIVRHGNHDDLIVRVFELGRDDIICMNRCHSECHECRRDVQILKCPRHGILAANGGNPHLMLRMECAEKRSKGLAPLLWIRAKVFKILLQGKANGVRLSSGGDNLCHRLNNGIDRPMKRTPRRKFGIKAERHRRRCIRHAMTHGNLCHHRFGWRELVLPTKRHENRRRTDGRVEALAQPLLTAHIEVTQIRNPHILKRAPHIFDQGGNLLQIGCLFIRRFDDDTDMLAHTVRCKEAACDPHDLLPPPRHDEMRLWRHDGDLRRLKIFDIRIAQECRDILRCKHDRHALLRL